MRTLGGWGRFGPLDGVARPDIGLCPGDTAAAAHQRGPTKVGGLVSYIHQDSPQRASDTHPHSPHCVAPTWSVVTFLTDRTVASNGPTLGIGHTSGSRGGGPRTVRGGLGRIGPGGPVRTGAVRGV